MDLSNKLIAEFAKLTNNKDGNSESMVYGTTVNHGDKLYVVIDGSDAITPVITTSEIKSGERVTVMIKDHTATIMGNITNPSASTESVGKVLDEYDVIVAKIGNFEMVIADKVTTEQLEAELAIIEEALIGKASIGELEAVKATIKDLDVEHLEAELAEIQEAIILKANITDLDAIHADIDILEGNVADINTIIGGNLTMDNIQSLVLTTSKVTVDNAFIKDAMIDRVSASKLTAGTINTSLINIGSEDGSMSIAGSLQQFKDADGNIRIQIGKDSTGDFTFVLYGADGKGQLINQNGITASAIGDGLIVNDMVADNAAISGGKLDINSVITEINDSTTTIKSSKIIFDDEGQTLDVAFSQLSTKVDLIEGVDGDLGEALEQISSNTTQIGVLQGEVNTLISNTTITKENGEVVQMKDDYSAVKQTVDSLSSSIGSLETTTDTVTSKVSSMEQTLASFEVELSEVIDTTESTSSKLSSMEQTLDSFETRISDNETTVDTVSSKVATMEQTVDGFDTRISATETTAETASSKVSTMEQTVNGFETRITNVESSTESNTTEIASLKLNNEEFAVEISKKTDKDSIISTINASTEAITISSSKVNITGFVTFSDLSTAGSTTINGANITTGYISCDRLSGGTISAADEINFIGGARIFGNDGELDAGLKVSAAGITLGGGTSNFLEGNWYMNSGDLDLEDGNMTVSGSISCGSSLSCDGTIYGAGNIALQNSYLWTSTGSAYRDNLRLGSHLIATDSSTGKIYMLTTGGSFTTVRCNRLESDGDVTCSNLWASSKVYASNVALTSDASLKTDIKYVDIDAQSISEDGLMSPNVNITTSDMHSFIETLPMTSYRMKKDIEDGIDYTHYGFIAQDILYSKVGSELIENGTITETEEILDEDGNIIEGATTTREILRYSENKFIAFLAGAVKEEIRQRKALEREIILLKEIIEKESN